MNISKILMKFYDINGLEKGNLATKNDLTKLGLGTSPISECLDALSVNAELSGGNSLINSLENHNVINTPIKLMGLRTEYCVDSAHFVVMLIEIHPIPSRIWINIYNVYDGKWKGWKSVTLT